jgi:hypothetical protein
MLKLKELFSLQHLFRWSLLLVFLLIPILGGNETREAYFGSLADGYIQVSVFVALTLFIFYGLETWLKIDTESLLRKHKKYQVPISALLGALPGCGGAIVVMTQYTMGRLGFGSVVAVLTSTMGDAAFLLLAQDPKAALVVFSTSITVGIIFGYLTEFIHGYDFLRQTNKKLDNLAGTFYQYEWVKNPWVWLLIPGLIVGLLTSFQADYISDNFFAQFGIENFNLWLGVTGAALSFILWFINPTAGTIKSNFFQCRTRGEVWDKVTADTAFVTVWVLVGYLAFELGVLWTGFDFGSLFSSIAPLLPLIGVMIGFLPGCGPQVIVTTMYLQGLIPFSAQLGNAISNDGDALFPAIAVAPKVSIIATIYTAIPALIIAYGYMFFFEM